MSLLQWNRQALLSVSRRFLALLTIVKQDPTITKSFILRKVRLMTTMKVVVIFCIFDAIGAMVLLISPKRNELEGCACTQIKALEERNLWLHPDDA